MSHWASQLIGKPWTPTGYGPDAFNCWGLVLWCSDKYYSSKLPTYQFPNAQERTANMALMNRVAETGDWNQLTIPVDGCIVAMSSQTEIHHIGLYLTIDGGRVLHSARNKGVLCQTLSVLRMHYNRIEFYQWLPSAKKSR